MAAPYRYFIPRPPYKTERVAFHAISCMFFEYKEKSIRYFGIIKRYSLPMEGIMKKSKAKLHILVDSREASISKAKTFFEEMNFFRLGQVEHIRETTLTGRLRVFLEECDPKDHLLISVHCISEERLEQIHQLLKQSVVPLRQITLASYDCFSHLREWCDKTGCQFSTNHCKRRTLTRLHDTAVPSSGHHSPRPLQVYAPEELNRIWIQYCLIISIISRTEYLGSTCRQLISGQSLHGELTEEYARAVRYFKLGEPDMAGGSYACEKTEIPNAIDLLRDCLNRIAVTDFNVLVKGDSGTGKEVIAWAIHELSDRRDETYLTLNCAGLPDELLESEMFGYQKGSHNMAHEDHPGLIEQARGGTLFLDELPEMSPRIQAKLLRFLESGEYRPLGSIQTRYSDTRIIAAGQGERLTGPNGIRPDLLSRINQVGIDLFPLHELESCNKGTISKIAHILLERFTWTSTYRDKRKHELTPCDIQKYQRKIEKESFSRLITGFKWKSSNIRGLNNFLRQWIVFGDGEFDRLCAADQNTHDEKKSIGSGHHTLHDAKLRSFLKEPMTRSELKSLGKKQPLRELKKSYIRHLFKIYSKIVEEENRSRDVPGKATQKEFAAIMNVSENTISLHLN